MKTIALSLLLSFTIVQVLSAQDIGARVSVVGADGKAHTGSIGAIYNGQYKIRFDGVKTETWMSPNQFTVLNNDNVVKANNAHTINENWNVGEKVEIFDPYTGKWENAIITLVYNDRSPKAWRIRVEDAAVNLKEFSVVADKIRPRNAAGNAASFMVNDRVDAYYPDGQPHGRAIVLSVAGNGKYRIHFEGCTSNTDETIDWSQLKKATSLPAQHADVTAVMGKWAMFVYSYPTTVVKGNELYREYNSGAKAPPLLIKADGTYIWYDEYNKPPVQGRWYTDAYIPGLHTGANSYNGIVLVDSHGVYWKMHMDYNNHLLAQNLCGGTTQGGNRIN